ncbi:hypothetical protein M9H77_19787 [Catharanthus roseus]|uniref:Uncharacterized protein n=1 Tax=Catharanthus roseus TaxID=4058 RepID=A0ACC0BB88_CATRO|nr:hypothetical protein M9H77_19787 [Catharanthus roseus]
MAEDDGPSKTTMENNIFNASFPVSYGMHQFGVQGNQTGPSYTSLEGNTFNAQTYDLTAYAPPMDETFNVQSYDLTAYPPPLENDTSNIQTYGLPAYAPISQDNTINAQTYGVTPYAPTSQDDTINAQTYGVTPYAPTSQVFQADTFNAQTYDLTAYAPLQDYQVQEEAPMDESIENFLSSYLTGLPESNTNKVMNNTMVVPENYIVQNQTNMANVEYNSNGNALNDMILPPPITSIQDMPSTSGSVNPNDLSNFFTPEEYALGDDLDPFWTQMLQDSHVWDWDNFKF